MRARERDGGGARRPRGDRPAAVRLQLVSHLPWLGCFPEETRAGALRWRDPADGAMHVLDRAGLASATRAVKRLVRDHRAALATLVGDVDAWQARVMAILDLCKPAIHDGAPAPSAWSPAVHAPAHVRRAHRLLAAAPLAPLVEALGWLHAVDGEAAATLTWLERHQGELLAIVALEGVQPDPRRVTLALRRLAALDGDRLVAPLVAALAAPAIHAVVPDALAYARGLHAVLIDRNVAPPVRPVAPVLGVAVFELIERLRDAPVAERRLALRALAAARLPELAAAWQDQWRRLDDLAARVRPAREPSFDQLVALHRELAALLRALAAGIAVERLACHLRHADARLVEAVEAMPELGPGAHAIALVTAHEAAVTPGERAGLAAMIAACAVDPAAHATMWRRAIAAQSRDWLHAVPDDAALGRRVGAALARVLDDASATVVFELCALAAHRHDVDAIVEHWRVWAARGHLSKADVELGLRLTSTADELRAFVDSRQVRLTGDDGDDDHDDLTLLAEVIGPAGVPLVRALLEAGEQARVLAVARSVRVARALRRPIAPLAATTAALPPALARYPRTLHAPLVRLAAAGAASLAAGILDDTFPEPRATERELATIEARLAAGAGDARLRRRADNLRARLVAPPAISDARVERLRAKLERAADLAALERWHDELRRDADRAACEALGLDPAAPPPWLTAPAYRRVLAAIPDLGDGPRALARRLLARRAGPPPWDLREVPFNRAWLERAAARGLDVTAWLDGIGPRRRGQVTLSLEDDPLEILRMGEHFSTCLSPGAMNFFSAVVNAAEVNKRVIYGRDPDGTVMGRCLVALTDGGGLVTFQAYSHGRDRFAGWVTDFVTELAARVGAVCVPSGPVRALAGCGWYDDGAVDLTGAFRFLADDSTFREALLALPLDRVLAELTARFAPLSLDGLTLPLYINLPELQRRPELIVPVLPLLPSARGIPLDALVRAAGLAELAGQADRLDARLVDSLRRASPEWYLEVDVVELFASRAPSRVLAALPRASHDVPASGLASWLYLRGLALAALERPVQAARALEEAVAQGPTTRRPLPPGDRAYVPLGERARARLRELAVAHPRLRLTVDVRG